MFGGAEGIRDEGALDSALMRPVNAWGYRGETNLSVLSAAYAFGLAKNHPFVDGNKRAALIASVGFLKLNGFDLLAPQPEAYRAMMALAASEMTEEAFAEWIGQNLEAATPRRDSPTRHRRRDRRERGHRERQPAALAAQERSQALPGAHMGQADDHGPQDFRVDRPAAPGAGNGRLDTRPRLFGGRRARRP